VFAPREVKLLSKLCFSASVALRIPTNAMIPKEIIKEVKIVLSGDAVMADQAREVVSLKFFKRIGGVLGLKPNLAITFTPWL
jgi:hypothetical protein